MSIQEAELDCGGECTCCDADCGTCCCCTGTCPPARTGTGYCAACGWYPEGVQPTPSPPAPKARASNQSLAREASSRANQDDER